MRRLEPYTLLLLLWQHGVMMVMAVAGNGSCIGFSVNKH